MSEVQLSPLEQLGAILTAITDPQRLINAVGTANDDAQAIEGLCREFQLTEPAARVVLDQQLRVLTRAAADKLRRHIADIQATPPSPPAGPAVE